MKCNLEELLAQAEAKLCSGDAHGAYIDVRLAREAGADSASLILVLGRALWDMGRVKEAMAEFEVGAVKSPENSEFVYWKGMCLLRLGKPGEADFEMDDAERRGASRGVTSIVRGMAMKALGRYPEAIDRLYYAAIHNPRGRMSRYHLATCYGRLGDARSAKAWFERAVDVDPKYGAALIGMAIACIVLNEGEEAIVWATKAIAVDGRWHWGWFARGLAKHVLGRLVEAREDYERAREAGPENVDVVYGLALVMGEIGEVAEAIDVVNNGLARWDSNPRLMELRGDLVSAVGKSGAALDHARATLRLARNKVRTLDLD